MDQITNQNPFASVSYTPMQLDGFGNVGVTPGVIPAYQPMQLPEIPSTAPASYTHMPDGSWADAQVTLSGAATAPSVDGTPPAPGSEEEQIAQMRQMYAQSMEIENMMFQQQMMMMQQRASLQQRQAIMARSNLNNNNSTTQNLTGPEIRGVDHGDDGGGDCGDCGGDE